MFAKSVGSLIGAALWLGTCGAGAQAPPADTDATVVRARHILIATADESHDAALGRITKIRKRIDDEVTHALTKLPPHAEPGTREQARVKALEGAFESAAAKESACPSKNHGGDLGFFPRRGVVVESFADPAFALQPYQLSEPVTTEFGVHLILVVARKARNEVKVSEVGPR